MDIKTGFLTLALLVSCIGTKADYRLGKNSSASENLPGPEDDLTTFNELNDIGFRISGGTQAAEGMHPYIVALTVGVPISILFCGGSLVAHRTVLTAAHCLKTMDRIESLRAVVGTSRWNSGGTAHALSRSLIHPDFVENAYMNDIALAYTASYIVFDTVVRPVTLSFAFVPQKVLVRLAGWGTKSAASKTLMSHLHELVSTTVDGNECAARWSISPKPNTPTLDPRTELCTFHSMDHGTCYGDSGGALTRVDNGQQIGVASWMFPCAQGFPDVYARISSYQSWLQANIID
ncbi:hypothetical protein PYW08_011521 [Mythimna loreyi]|uniref:Uncharacterized protein n=1 Tax=Mythimna loreyi TaxID=667449 RepID=A0ACC2QNM6_9NEOP|nr:hypothetical protein PYW08_011521 [Mythimna loreyi]